MPKISGKGRPQVQCSAYGGNDPFTKDCWQDNYYSWCRSRSHYTNMCHAPNNTGKNDSICIYCGSKHHTSSNCSNRPKDNKEEPKATPRNLFCHGPQSNTNAGNSRNFIINDPQERANNHFPYQDHRHNENRGSHQQTRFDEHHNKHYSPNSSNFQQSPRLSLAGQDFSATLVEMAYIQSKSLELMIANQRSQQDVYNELTRANKDKANDAMFASIKTYDGTN